MRSANEGGEAVDRAARRRAADPDTDDAIRQVTRSDEALDVADEAVDEAVGPPGTKTRAAVEEAAEKEGIPLKHYLIGLGLLGGAGTIAYGAFRNPPQQQQQPYYG